MEKLSNTEAELIKSVAYKKTRVGKIGEENLFSSQPHTHLFLPSEF